MQGLCALYRVATSQASAATILDPDTKEAKIFLAITYGQAMTTRHDSNDHIHTDWLSI
jgi:hypothetical protein